MYFPFIWITRYILVKTFHLAKVIHYQTSFRIYAHSKTKKTLNELDLELGVTYAEVRNVNGELIVEELEGEHKTSNMQIHDKGFLGTPDNESRDKCEDGTVHISKAQYKKANTALKYKEPKG